MSSYLKSGTAKFYLNDSQQFDYAKEYINRHYIKKHVVYKLSNMYKAFFELNNEKISRLLKIYFDKRGRIYNSSCTCDMYKKNGKCAHIAAAIITLENEKKENNKSLFLSYVYYVIAAISLILLVFSFAYNNSINTKKFFYNYLGLDKNKYTVSVNYIEEINTGIGEQFSLQLFVNGERQKSESKVYEFYDNTITIKAVITEYDASFSDIGESTLNFYLNDYSYLNEMAKSSSIIIRENKGAQGRYAQNYSVFKVIVHVRPYHAVVPLALIKKLIVITVVFLALGIITARMYKNEMEYNKKQCQKYENEIEHNVF